MKKIIELLKIGDLEQSILVRLKDNLNESFNRFNMTFKIIRDEFQLENSDYNLERKKYDADKILKRIINHTKNHKGFRILGVMNEDIYSEKKDFVEFVFGIAIKPKKRISGVPVVSLISITRLREQFYGRPENKNLLELRILKEAVHEIGHTFSLEHCNEFCIMRLSDTIMDTDKKPAQFCESCAKKVINFL